MEVVHIECSVDKAYVDEANKLVTTPAYMLAENLDEAARGIIDCVNNVLKLVEIS